MLFFSDLNIKMQKFYDENFPKVLPVIAPLFAGLPLLLPSIHGALFGLTAVSFIGICTFLDPFLYGRYEQQKREMILDYLQHINDDELTPIITHLYRLQDHYGRNKVVKGKGFLFR